MSVDIQELLIKEAKRNTEIGLALHCRKHDWFSLSGQTLFFPEMNHGTECPQCQQSR